ncbi:sigma factor-like helix-turn-helix DNA-binding protein [Sporosarcina sp. SAFN-015]|uniref:sigma factor-like helix-turn-helix DNA-binding protein n=1 Tax=Sporosarcina sp. SAFN-015 TaxID=3387274 RepID=UPI003F7F780A
MKRSYLEQFKEDVRKAYTLVRAGELPMGRRIKMLKRVSDRYVLAQAADYHAAKAVGKNPPIPLRDSDTLNTCGLMLIHEYMSNKDADKVTNDEYPILSDRQLERRMEKQRAHSDLQYGDLRFLGKRRLSGGCDDSGSNPYSVSKRVIDRHDPMIARIDDYNDLYDALDNAGLTDRQRQALDLVFFDNMTQEEARAVMGVNKATISEHVSVALTKLLEYMTKD